LTRTIGKLTMSSTQKPLTTLARACLGFLLTLVLANLAFGEGVDDYIKSQMEEQHIPGLGLAVVRRGKVIKSAGYGWADVDNKIPASAHTVFQLQSITKTFTATAVMMLVEQKKISVTDKINAYLEGVPDNW